jgi:hypothetical protein
METLRKAAQGGYLEALKSRAKRSRVYVRHQAVGLAIAELLGDRKHKSLYMKLAKEHDVTWLLSLAAGVVERRQVKERGAYFMRLVTEEIKRASGANPKEQEVRIAKVQQWK